MNPVIAELKKLKGKRLVVVLTGNPRLPLEKNTVRFVTKDSGNNCRQSILNEILKEGLPTLYVKSTHSNSLLDLTITVKDHGKDFKSHQFHQNVSTLNYQDLTELFEKLSQVCKEFPGEVAVLNFIDFPNKKIPFDKIVR